ncbi:MAG: ribonuclease HII [Parafilimonas sp.]
MLKPYHRKRKAEAGCDEAGRGCFAGPVVAAAVILPKNFYHPELNDSKLLTPEQREMLRVYIEANALHYAVGMVDNDEIDMINILRASFKAMHLALEQLPVEPALILVDGNRFYAWRNVRHECIIKGDGIYASIAAASVLAKTWRDNYMRQMHEEFPQYNWAQNKGYGTPEHRRAIEEHGLCRYHRKSFNILSAQLEIEYEFEEEVA